MVDFIFLWLRGLVFTVAAFFFVGVIYGVFGLTMHVPNLMVPLLMLVFFPVVFGIITEGKV